MYRVSKTFTFPMGHRLLRHSGGCFNCHGHNYSVKVCFSSENVNEDGMVIDFGIIKELLNPVFNSFDHAFMINRNDKIAKEHIEAMNMKVVYCDNEPTAENMAFDIYKIINDGIDVLREKSKNELLEIEYVTVYETDNSEATYSEN